MFSLILLFFSYTSSTSISAAELITNGGFETGSFTGWTFQNPSTIFRPWQVTTSGFGGDDGAGFNPVPTATTVQQGAFNAWNGVTAGANESFVLFQQFTVPAGQSLSIHWLDKYQMNYTQYCGSASTPCGTAHYYVEITNTSGTVLQNLYRITTQNNSNTNTGWQNHNINLGNSYAGQTIRIRFRTLTTLSFRGPGQVEIDNVRVQSPGLLVPTAADSTVSGRVTTNEGLGISFANVTLTDQTGNVRTAVTNQFGVYSFDEVEAGQTYIVAVGHKKYVFPNNPQVISVSNDTTEVDFQANP